MITVELVGGPNDGHVIQLIDGIVEPMILWIPNTLHTYGWDGEGDLTALNYMGEREPS